MPFSPLRPDPRHGLGPGPGPDLDPAILHVYGAVPLSTLDPAFDTRISGRQDLALSAWLDIPNTFVYGWRSDAPEHAGLVELTIFRQDQAGYADPHALLALLVHEAALFTVELRRQIILLLP